MKYAEKSPALWNAIHHEEERQQNTIELIASENIVSDAVREAQGSVLTSMLKDILVGVITAVVNTLIKLNNLLLIMLKNYSMLNLLMFNPTLVHKQIWLFIKLC